MPKAGPPPTARRRSPAPTRRSSPTRATPPRAGRCRRLWSRRCRIRSRATRGSCSPACRTRGARAAPTRRRRCLGLAPADPDALVSPDRWWSERRMVARAAARPQRAEARLRPLRRRREARRVGQRGRPRSSTPAGSRCASSATPREAAERFALAAVAAETPLSIARAEYWRGRAAEALGDGEEATLHYENAATQPVAYYGQLAAERLGVKRLALRAPPRTAEGAGAQRRGPCGRRALRRGPRRPRGGARLRGGALLARRGADRGDGRGGEAPRRRRDPGPVRQDRDAARLRLRRDGLPVDRRARLPAARPFGRSRQRLCGRAAGERVRLARGVGRGRQGPDADPALDRGLDRAPGGRRLRLRAADRRSGVQHPARRGLPRRR